MEHEDDDGNIQLISVTEQHLVEDACINENTLRYDQTRSPYPTPPMQEPLYDDFTGPNAQTYIAGLLDGSYEIPTTVDKSSHAFLNQCRSPLPPVRLQVDEKSNRKFWRRNPEMKGSEPHGLHNGHYTAASYSTLLNSCDAVCRNFPLQTGLVAKEHCYIMNFAIEKKPGVFLAKLMRTIQMMDAELQANNKLVGKEAMKSAEAHRLIPKGQCGSRKRHQAIDLALSKTLVWDQLILRHQAAGWILNDAKSCFDRVVHWVAQVALRRFGMPWNAVNMMFKTLQFATHRVRTGFGDSTRTFCPPSTVPFQGCGQGNGAGPTIWVAISSILIDTMEAAGHGFDFVSAIDWALNVAECFCFVDNTDLIEAASSLELRGKFLVHQIQKALSLWSECIRTTGGAINPMKSFWWLIDFKWDANNGRWNFRRNVDMAGEVHIKDSTNETVNLVRLQPNQTEKTLGIKMAPQYNKNDQQKALMDKAVSWAMTVKHGSLLPADSLPLMQTTILKSLEYSTPLIHLSLKEWEKIMSPILQVALPKAGICRTFPRDVVYGPQRFQGLGVPHPLGTQLIRQIDMMLRHPANRTTTTGYLEACLQSHQLATGTSYGLLQQDYSNTAILASDTWLKRTWKPLDKYQIHLEFDSPPLTLTQEGDLLLNDAFIDLEVDQKSLKWLNWCAKWLHVVTLSDIVTADGKYIELEAWQGDRSNQREPLMPGQGLKGQLNIGGSYGDRH